MEYLAALENDRNLEISLVSSLLSCLASLTWESLFCCYTAPHLLVVLTQKFDTVSLMCLVLHTLHLNKKPELRLHKSLFLSISPKCLLSLEEDMNKSGCSVLLMKMRWEEGDKDTWRYTDAGTSFQTYN